MPDWPIEPAQVDTRFRGGEVANDHLMVKLIEQSLREIGPDLRALGHSHAHLDANARYYIARHLVGTLQWIGWKVEVTTHPYTVASIVHGASPAPCVICGGGRQAASHA